MQKGKAAKKNKKSLSRPLVLAALRHTSKPVNEDRSENVEHDVHPHEAEIAPCVAVVTLDLHQESIGAGDLAERALASGAGVLEVSAVGLYEGSHVVLAGHVGGRDDFDEFDGFAVGICAGDTGG